MLAVRLLAKLAALRDHATHAPCAWLTLLWSYLGHSPDDLLREWLSLIVIANIVKLVIVLLIGFICYVGHLFVILLTLLGYLLENMLIF